MRSGRVSSFFAAAQKQIPEAQQQQQKPTGQPVRRSRKLSVDSLVPKWRSSTDAANKTGQHRSRATADVAPVSFTASVTGSQWLKVRAWVGRCLDAMRTERNLVKAAISTPSHCGAHHACLTKLCACILAGTRALPVSASNKARNHDPQQ